MKQGTFILGILILSISILSLILILIKIAPLLIKKIDKSNYTKSTLLFRNLLIITAVIASFAAIILIYLDVDAFELVAILPWLPLYATWYIDYKANSKVR